MIRVGDEFQCPVCQQVFTIIPKGNFLIFPAHKRRHSLTRSQYIELPCLPEDAIVEVEPDQSTLAVRAQLLMNQWNKGDLAEHQLRSGLKKLLEKE